MYWNFKNGTKAYRRESVFGGIVKISVALLILYLFFRLMVSAYQDCADAGYNDFECRMMLQGNRSVIVLPGNRE